MCGHRIKRTGAPWFSKKLLYLCKHQFINKQYPILKANKI